MKNFKKSMMCAIPLAILSIHSYSVTVYDGTKKQPQYSTLENQTQDINARLYHIIDYDNTKYLETTPTERSANDSQFWPSNLNYATTGKMLWEPGINEYARTYAICINKTTDIKNEKCLILKGDKHDYDFGNKAEYMLNMIPAPHGFSDGFEKKDDTKQLNSYVNSDLNVEIDLTPQGRNNPDPTQESLPGAYFTIKNI
ncbi:hypothetical protein OAO18_07665 [Francisellaceae bacterium]|nr:hypothetical protein [Francisellaceae bacterium]